MESNYNHVESLLVYITIYNFFLSLIFFDFISKVLLLIVVYDCNDQSCLQIPVKINISNTFLLSVVSNELQCIINENLTIKMQSVTKKKA